MTNDFPPVLDTPTLHFAPPPDPTENPLLELGRQVLEWQARLSQSEAQFRIFMDFAPSLNATIKDSQGRYLYVNQHTREKFGGSEADWLGKTTADILGPEVAGPIAAHDQQVLKSGEPFRAIEHAPTPDGHSAEWLVTRFRFPASDGGWLIGAVGLDLAEVRQVIEVVKIAKKEGVLDV